MTAFDGFPIFVDPRINDDGGALVVTFSRVDHRCGEWVWREGRVADCPYCHDLDERR